MSRQLLNDLHTLIAQWESETLEFKKSTSQLPRAIETLTAFANSKGGTIIFGVQDDGTIVGQRVADSTIREISNSIMQAITPRIYPSITTHDIDGRQILLVSIPEGALKPYVTRDHPYKRVGTTNQAIPREEYERLLMDRNRHRMLWDMEMNELASVSDLDEDLIRRFVRTAQKARNLGVSENLPLDEILSGLDMLNEGSLTNGALALFGKRPQQHFIQLHVKVARFNGTTKDEFLDNQRFEGNLFELYDRIQQFISSHLRVAGKVPKDFGLRNDTAEYPLDALREATVNAIVHRDYYDPGGYTEIAIFDDRIEVWNNGLLPAGITISDLLKPHRSILRNPLIAKAFFLYGVVESWGRGTLKIFELCQEAGLPKPVYTENSGGVEIKILKSLVKRPVLQSLTDTQKKILQYFESHDKARVSDIAFSLGITKRAIQKNLKELESMVEWIGKSKNDPNGFFRRKL
jgi:ATP-dependent DNA helicase RecG